MLECSLDRFAVRDMRQMTAVVAVCSLQTSFRGNVLEPPLLLSSLSLTNASLLLECGKLGR